MRHFPSFSLMVAMATLLCVLHVGTSVLCAQHTSLKLCSETLQKDRQVINKTIQPNQGPVFALLDPRYQRLKQTYTDWTECVKGQKAPLSSFVTLNGESYDTSSLAGKIIVINFWFTTCAPCRAEMPALNQLVDEYKGKNVLFLGFATDRADRLKPAYFEQNRFNFKIIADAHNFAKRFYVMGYPTTYIVDQRGVIRDAWVGLDNASDKLSPYHKAKAVIDGLLAAPSK